jgi:TonB family protein
LIQQAARGAPAQLAERLEEEWLADLEARCGRLDRLQLAAGCCWATRVIAREHCAVGVAATATATGSKTMSTYARNDDVYFSRRTITVMLIIGLHAFIIYAFATGLGPHALRNLMTNMEVVPIVEHQVDHRPPPLNDPKIPTSYTHIDVQTTELKIDVPLEPPTVVVPEGPTLVFTGPPSTPIALVKRVMGGPGKGFPNTDDYYPADAIRKGLEGPVTVQTCVDERGRLTAAPAVTRSSGTAILDEGALRLARAGSGHYRPTTEDGRPVPSCYQYLINFQLRK